MGCTTVLRDKQEKEQSITQLNVFNSCYVLDQQGNYMFRPLEAIFRLHKIDLEEKEYNIYSKCNGVSMLRSQRWAGALTFRNRASYI